jgi:hypothetical protein
VAERAFKSAGVLVQMPFPAGAAGYATRHDTPRCIAGCLLETDTKKMRMNIHNADAAFAF